MTENQFTCPECGSTETQCSPPYTELKCLTCMGVFRKQSQPEPPKRIFPGDPTKLDSFYNQTASQESHTVTPKISIPPEELPFPPEASRIPSLEEAELLDVRQSPDKRDPKLLNSVSIKELVYHRTPNGQTLPIESIFNTPLEVEEATYSRPGGKVGEEWTPIDLGWVGENAGMIVIQNLSGKNLQRQPTKEEKAEIDKKVIEVGISFGKEVPDRFTLVLPKQNFRWNLIPELTYSLRSQSGRIDFNLYVIPR